MCKLVLAAFVSFGIVLPSSPSRAQCNLEEVQAFSGPGISPGAGFGGGIAISGNLAIVGASRETSIHGAEAGTARIFRWDGDSWEFEALLLPSIGNPGAFFGFDVDISGDRAIVGAWRQNDGELSESGAAFVFRRTGTQWAEEARLTASSADSNDWFGTAVDIEGDRILVGAHRDDEVGDNTGSVFAYRLIANNWVETQRLNASDADSGDFYGSFLSMSGTHAVIGVYGRDSGVGANSGAAYVYVWNGNSWIYQATLTPTNGGANFDFGASTAISGDRILIGASGNFGLPGRAYVFARNGSTWTEQAVLTAPDPQPDARFGGYLGLSGDRAVIGAFNAEKAYAFERVGSSWTLHSVIQPLTVQSGDRFGQNVATDGVHVLIGAVLDDNQAGADAGIVYAYTTQSIQFLRQPVSMTAAEGYDASFSVIVDAVEPVMHQWRRNGFPIVDGPSLGGGTIIGATTNALILQSVGETDEAQYSCLVLDNCGATLVTSAATLTVEQASATCNGDANSNGVVNFADIAEVLASFGVVCP